MRDCLTSKQIKQVMSPKAAGTANTAYVGTVIDHQGYDGASYVILSGGQTDVDATFAVLLEESDTNFSGAAVDDADMVSQTNGTAPETAAAFTFAADDQVRSLGYIGSKRYTRLTITPSGNDSGNNFVAAVCVLERAAHEPITKASA
jgi:hypothetical protein